MTINITMYLNDFRYMWLTCLFPSTALGKDAAFVSSGYQAVPSVKKQGP